MNAYHERGETAAVWVSLTLLQSTQVIPIHSTDESVAESTVDYWILWYMLCQLSVVSCRFIVLDKKEL